MPVQQHLSHCLQLIDSMHQYVRSGKWHKLPSLQSEYSLVFEQMKAEAAAAPMDEAATQAMIRLEQQQRRLQRLLAAGLKETSEKLSIIDDTRKRLQVSGQAASALAV